jgi:transcriptional regulator with XRE-family HTH domain
MKGGEQVIKNRLKELREERGISQEKLSELSGISRTTLSKIENNEEVNVNTRTIAKLAEVFDVKPSEIFLM